MFHVLYAFVSMNDIQTYYYRISIVLLHYSNISRFPPGSDIDVYKYKNIRDASNIFTDLFLRGEKSKYGKIGTKFFLEVYQLSFFAQTLSLYYKQYYLYISSKKIVKFKCIFHILRN